METIVGLFNTGEKEETVSIQASAVGLPEGAVGHSHSLDNHPSDYRGRHYWGCSIAWSRLIPR